MILTNTFIFGIIFFGKRKGMMKMCITSKDIFADMHTHTTFSLHAFSTVKENIDCGKANGMKAIAITDHLFANGDEVALKNEFSRIAYLERTINRAICNDKNKDFYIIGGAEFNLGQEIPEGKDYDKKISKLLWRPIGLHTWFYDINGSTLNSIFNAFTKAVVYGGYNAITHPEREIHKVNWGKNKTLNDDVKELLKKIVYLARDNNIYLEVNEQSLERNENGDSERLAYWLNIAKEEKVKISLGTDAHYCEAVGKFDKVIKLINEIDYPIELILNCNKEMFEKEFSNI